MAVDCIICITLLALVIPNVLCGGRSEAFLTRKAFLPKNAERTKSTLVSHMTVNCTVQGIDVSFERDSILNLGVVIAGQLHLADPACVAVANRSHFTLRTDFLGCNTTVVIGQNNTSAVLKNKVIISPPIMYPNTDGASTAASGDVSRPIEIGFSCTYSNEQPAEASHLPPTIQTADIKIYNTDSYSQEVDLQNSISRGTSLYVKVNAYDATSNKLDFIIDSCYLSSRRHVDVTDELIYLIINGCPVYRDVEFKEDTGRQYSTRKFLFRAKRFFKNKPAYLHCTLSVCRNTDGNQCQTQQQVCSEKTELLDTSPFHKVLQQSLLVTSLRDSKYRAKPSPATTTTSTTTTTTTKRPVLLEDKQTPAPMQHDEPEPSMCKPAPPCNCPVIVDTDTQTGDETVLAGSSADMVSIWTTVIVGIVSFFIGAGLIGVMFLVHIKTDPRRKMQAVAMSEDGLSSQGSTPPTVKLMKQANDVTSSDESS